MKIVDYFQNPIETGDIILQTRNSQLRELTVKRVTKTAIVTNRPPRLSRIGYKYNRTTNGMDKYIRKDEFRIHYFDNIINLTKLGLR